jgi:predicted nucleic acid-binding protein
MIVVDTSVWVDHLRAGDDGLVALLEQGRVLVHPFVIGEIACGILADRAETLDLLTNMPAAPCAEHREVLVFIEQHRLYGRGIGYVDAHLLASVALGPGSMLWTRDRRLHSTAAALRCAYAPSARH